MNSIPVNIPGASYQVQVDAGIIDRTGAEIAPLIRGRTEIGRAHV